ncbi:MAG TPA: sigma-70 family RNA polymerase sigma factor [Kofleriaceae bacterium]
MPLELVEPGPRDEADLVAACLRGDGSAQRTLFRREYPRVYATVYRMLGSARDADDVVQDAFIAAFRALPTFRGEARLSTWLDRIAVRLVYHHVALRRRAPVPLDVVEEPGGAPSEQLRAREGLRRLYAALGRLKPDARMAFALHAIDGRSVAEVATLTGTSRVAAKLRIWRARRQVEQLAEADPVLADYLGGRS